jgi:hypothetical protein
VHWVALHCVVRLNFYRQKFYITNLDRQFLIVSLENGLCYVLLTLLILSNPDDKTGTPLEEKARNKYK